MKLRRKKAASGARRVASAALLAAVLLLTLSCSHTSLTYDASTGLYVSKRGSTARSEAAQKLRERMVGWEIPYRGPFRLPDGSIAMPRGLPPIGLDAAPGKTASDLPCIWGLDGRAAGPKDDVKIIVAKVFFNDFNDESHEEISRSDLENWLFNDNEGPAPDSLTEYYHRESFGQLAVSGIVLPETGSYELNGSFMEFIFPVNPPKYTELWDSLVTQIDEDVNGSDYDGNDDGAIDAVIVVPPDGDPPIPVPPGEPFAFVDNHATTGMITYTMDGKAVETYSVQSNVFGDPLHRYAVPWHEFGHILGLPDLYDGMGAPSPGPDGDEGTGPGGWAVMAQSGELSCNLPFSAPMKLLLGWDTPVELSTEPGTSENIHLFYANEDEGQTYRVTLGGGTYYLDSTPVEYAEYILFEARSLTPEGAPEDGLLVWHINENVYLEKVFGAQQELPNSDEEYKFTDIVETPYNADSIVDKPYDENPSSLVRVSDIWPYNDYDELRSVVPTGVEYEYKHPSLLPALSTAPYHDLDASLNLSVSDIARADPGATFHYEVSDEPPPPPPEVTSFTPQITYSGSGAYRRVWLHLSVTGNETAISFTITLDYLDGEGLPQSEQWDSAGGDFAPVDITPLLPNQRVTLTAVASDGVAESDPVVEQLDAVTLLGDVNADDAVDDSDAAALQAVLGLDDSDEEYRDWYDTDGNSRIDERDLAYIGYWFGSERPIG